MFQAKHYALIGFANSGKSTLFNFLSGAKQTVGNWSGVTVSAAHTDVVFNNTEAQLYDLPGLNSLTKRCEQGQDLTVTHQYIKEQNIDCLINVVDITQLQRQLYLTTQLLELGVPMIVVLNKVDKKEACKVDLDAMSQQLGCPVVAISAQQEDSLSDFFQALTLENSIDKYYQVAASDSDNSPGHISKNKKQSSSCECKAADESIEIIHSRHQYVQQVVAQTTVSPPEQRSFSDKIDNVVLHPIAGIPIFLAMMYFLFMFAINVGSAFIDFFDILSGILFVDYPLYFLASFNLPAWMLNIVEGIGSGIQTVATFIPVIVCLFIGLSLLESSGYLARAAFVVDNAMQKIGLPGKAFVPLIVGFGCTVPAVMSARVLDSERERITTVMMAPFMSCGARLPVYALFAAAFFSDNGQNLVFLLYLIGIAAAVFTGFLLKKTTLPGNSSLNIMELPLYEMPTFSYLFVRVYRRTKSFVTGAGKTIVIVVCILNFLNSIGTDGRFDHKDSEQSLLSSGVKVVMPVLAPMGVKEENWQAGVGIITGIFAKEVLVATFNSLYTPHAEDKTGELSLSQSFKDAVTSIKDNMAAITVGDPLSMNVGQVSDLSTASAEQEVALTTYQVMQASFNGQLGAFCYLLFILLYTPCVAAMGAIKSEVGTKWAIFAGGWSFTLAYLAATLCYQVGNFFVNPSYSLAIIAAVIATFYAIYAWLKSYGKKILTIPIAVKYS